MALAVTSLAGAISQNATAVTLTAFTNPSTGGIGPSTLVMVDGEKMLVTAAPNAPTVQVARGYTGTLGVAHNALAPVVYGLSSDFMNLASQGSATIAVSPEATYSVNGAITIPLVDQTIYITKGSLCALTLAGPALDSKVTVRVISLTAFAHTITYTAGFSANTTSSDVATFTATSGATFVFTAINGLWVTVASSGAVIA